METTASWQKPNERRGTVRSMRCGQYILICSIYSVNELDLTFSILDEDNFW